MQTVQVHHIRDLDVWSPALLVKQRRVVGAVAEPDGFGHLEGVLRLEVKVSVKERRERGCKKLTSSLRRARFGSTSKISSRKNVLFLQLANALDYQSGLGCLWFVFLLGISTSCKTSPMTPKVGLICHPSDSSFLLGVLYKCARCF